MRRVSPSLGKQAAETSCDSGPDRLKIARSVPYQDIKVVTFSRSGNKIGSGRDSLDEGPDIDLKSDATTGRRAN
jgi:hypothetical protein